MMLRAGNDLGLVITLQKQYGLITHTPKFGLDVETDDTTYAPKRYEKIYYSQDEAFWGDEGRLPSSSEHGWGASTCRV